MDPNRPAWLTTEFWLTVIPSALLLYKAFTGHDTAGIDVHSLALLAVGIMTGAYAISRAITKKGIAYARVAHDNAKMGIEAEQEAQALARRHDFELRRPSSPMVIGGGAGGAGGGNGGSGNVSGFANYQKLADRIAAVEARVPATKDKPRKVTKAAPRKTTTSRTRR